MIYVKQLSVTNYLDIVIYANLQLNKYIKNCTSAYFHIKKHRSRKELLVYCIKCLIMWLSIPILNMLHWLPVKFRIRFNILVVYYWWVICIIYVQGLTAWCFLMSLELKVEHMISFLFLRCTLWVELIALI